VTRGRLTASSRYSISSSNKTNKFLLEVALNISILGDNLKKDM
jgi:hypothetical protein